MKDSEFCAASSSTRDSLGRGFDEDLALYAPTPPIFVPRNPTTLRETDRMTPRHRVDYQSQLERDKKELIEMVTKIGERMLSEKSQ